MPQYISYETIYLRVSSCIKSISFSFHVLIRFEKLITYLYLAGFTIHDLVRPNYYVDLNFEVVV